MDLFAAATFHKNTACGNNNASAFQLVYIRVLKLPTICSHTSHDGAEDNAAQARQRELNVGLKSSFRRCHQVNIGEAIYVWRDNIGLVGPGIGKRIKKHAVDAAHNTVVKTADQYRNWPALVAEPRDKYDGEGKKNANETNADDPVKQL